MFVTATTLPTACTKCSQGSQSAYGKTNSKLKPNSIIQSCRISSQKPSNLLYEFAFSSFPNIHDRQDKANLSITTYHNFLFHSSILPASQRKILPFATLPPSKSRGVVFHLSFSGVKKLTSLPRSQIPNSPPAMEVGLKRAMPLMINAKRPQASEINAVWSRYIPRGMMDRTRTDINIMFNPFRIHGTGIFTLLPVHYL